MRAKGITFDFCTFVDFWLFCAERWGDDMWQEHYVLKSVGVLRNACTHNSLLVHGLDARNAPNLAAQAEAGGAGLVAGPWVLEVLYPGRYLARVRAEGALGHLAGEGG